MSILKLAKAIVLVLLATGLAQFGHASQIVVGQVTPLSGPEASQGRAYAAGMQLVFNAINNSGGVNGHTFALVSKDDAGRPEATLTLTRQILSDDRPMVFAGFVGTQGVAEIVSSGILQKEKVAMVGYRSAEADSDAPLLYNVRASFGDELNKITEHLGTIGVNSLAVLHEAGPRAAKQIAAIEEAARKHNSNVVARASYEAGTTRVSDAVDTLVKARPQAILLVTTGAAGARFIEQYRANGGSAQIFVYSGADMERVAKQISEERLSFVSTVMRGVAIAQVVPNPYDNSILAKELNRARLKDGAVKLPVSYVMMEGYIAAKVIVEAVRRQGQRPTRDGMAAALDGINYLNLGGYAVGFKPGVRNGSKFVELTIISDTGKVRQ